MSEIIIKPGERLDDLQRDGLKILQRPGSFRFGTDAVLLSDFALIRPRDRVADFGTGTGVIALLLCARHPGIKVNALEIQEDVADMACRSVALNGLSDKITVLNADIKDAPKLLGYGQTDHIVCNPPYFKPGAALTPENENKRISRLEGEISISELCVSAAQTLKSGGRLSVVFPAMRMFEMMTAMHSAALAPKRVRTVHGTSAHAPRLILLDAVKHGGSQLDWLPPLILSNPDGSPTEEWNRIYAKSDVRK